jgi:hypothetical protein
MNDDDFEWFEHKYPGWYDKYGRWWERYTEFSKKNGHKHIAFEPDAGYQYPHRCWTCMVPCFIRDDSHTLIPQPHPVSTRRTCGPSTRSAASSSRARTCC